VNRKKVAVGISGGVDSAVSALLLKKAGFDVVGVHLYCWPPKSEVEKDGVTREEWIKKNGCRADEDRALALKTALEIGIPFKTLDFSEEYNSRVIKYFYDQYEAGRTPNPDVLCNSEIKFGLFLSWALENGFDYIATGHYAKLVRGDSGSRNEIAAVRDTETRNDEYVQNDSRLLGNDDVAGLPHSARNDGGVVRLMIPEDKHKDQTYFLWKLGQKELSHTLFPLGDLSKNEVREIAKESGLSVATKKDSQGICFVGNVEVREFLARRLKVQKGKVFDTKGAVVGEHDGVWFYTIGQRGGWKINGKAQKQNSEKTALGDVTPVYYVISKDAKENVLVVGEADEATGDFFEVTDVNEIGAKHRIVSVKELYVRIRHGGELIGARVGKTKGGLNVELVKKIRGIASGQSAVFYSADGECLGGGTIL